MRARSSALLCLIALGCQGDGPAPPSVAAALGEAQSASPRVAPAAAAPTPIPPERGVVLDADLVALNAAGRFKALSVQTAEVLDDPAFHTPKRYRGYALAEVLAIALEGVKLGDGIEVQLVAADGYTATVPAEQLSGAPGVLAFEDVDAPEGQAWLSFSQGKREITPAPFYLVWHQTPYGPAHPWPYQLARLRVVDVAVAYGAAYPSHDPGARAGFELYKSRCSACHSVNLVGGVLGPELNVPLSVTEYWSDDHLRAFIANPRAYRARSVMPNLGLSDAEIGSILGYLEAMAEAKICADEASCGAH